MIHLPDDPGSRNAVHSITSSARASSVGGTIATVALPKMNSRRFMAAQGIRMRSAIAGTSGHGRRCGQSNQKFFEIPMSVVGQTGEEPPEQMSSGHP